MVTNASKTSPTLQMQTPNDSLQAKAIGRWWTDTAKRFISIY